MSRLFIFLGAFLILLGLGLSLWYWLYGLPVYLLGILLLFFSKMQIVSKVLWALVPLLIYYPLGWFMRFSNNATPETFLIPSTFQGTFRVVYGENCGVTPLVQNGRQVLKIPSDGILLADGILLVKPELEDGWRNQEFFFVTPQGSKEPVFANIMKADKVRSNIFVTGPVSVTYNLDQEGGKNQKLMFSYVDFEISPKDTIYHENNSKSNRFDSMTKFRVMACRSNVH